LLSFAEPDLTLVPPPVVLVLATGLTQGVAPLSGLVLVLVLLE